MPVYEFQCTNCNKVFEQIRNPDRAKLPAACPDCSHPAKRILSTPNLQTNLGTKLRNKLDRKQAKAENKGG